MILMLLTVRLEHPTEEQGPSNSDQKSSSFEAGRSKKLKSAQTSSSEVKSAVRSSSEKVTRMPKPASSPQSGRMAAWPDEKREEGDSSKDEKRKVGEAGKKKRKKRRRRQKDAAKEVEVVRQTWRRGETSSSASSGKKGNSRENTGRAPGEKETVIEAEKGGDGESDGCVEEEEVSKEDGDAFDARIGLEMTAAGRRALRMKRSFATTADSTEGEQVKSEGKLEEKDRSVSSSCCCCREEKEEKSSLLGGNFERATVHNCSDQSVICSPNSSSEQIGCSVTTRLENDNVLLDSDLEEDTSKSLLGMVPNDVMSADEKEDEIFDPPSTEILDYKNILSVLKEKHREQQRKLQEEVSSPQFWMNPPHPGL